MEGHEGWRESTAKCLQTMAGHRAAGPMNYPCRRGLRRSASSCWWRLRRWAGGAVGAQLQCSGGAACQRKCQVPLEMD